MNLNNIFAGLLGFIMAGALTWLFYALIDDWLNAITPIELRIFLQVVYVAFVIIVCFIVPINLSITDDNGQN